MLEVQRIVDLECTVDEFSEVFTLYEPHGQEISRNKQQFNEERLNREQDEETLQNTRLPQTISFMFLYTKHCETIGIS